MVQKCRLIRLDEPVGDLNLSRVQPPTLNHLGDGGVVTERDLDFATGLQHVDVGWQVVIGPDDHVVAVFPEDRSHLAKIGEAVRFVNYRSGSVKIRRSRGLPNGRRSPLQAEPLDPGPDRPDQNAVISPPGLDRSDQNAVKSPPGPDRSDQNAVSRRLASIGVS